MRIAAAMFCLTATLAAAIEVEAPPFRAREAGEGVIRIWASAAMKPVIDGWERGLRRTNAKITIERDLRGSDVAMAGLYTGEADVALIGRPATAPEVKAFEWIYRYRPTAIEVATGSVVEPGHSPALLACVHRDNPLSRLTLAQLDAAFSRERLRGASAAITTWGDLGLRGEWARQPIRLYTFDTESGTGRFFRETVLEDSRMLDWDRITEFDDTSRFENPSHDAGRKILDALSRDRYGLAVASGNAPSGVKCVPLSADGKSFVPATRDNLVTRRYPLTRVVFAYVNRKPGVPLDAPVAELLRYVRSPAGQRDIAAGGFLPLSAPEPAR